MTDPCNTDSATASCLRSVQRLLWTAVSDTLQEAERDEVKKAIGVLLVEENQALFDEASALAEILGDVQLTTSALLHRRQLCTNPERNMVEAEILVVMDKLRSMATTAVFSNSSAADRDPDAVVPTTGPKDKAVYDYIQTSTALKVQRTLLGMSHPVSVKLVPLDCGAPELHTMRFANCLQNPTDRPGSARLRPSTASSRPATASSVSRPSTASSTATSNTTTSTNPAQVVAGMQGKLNVFCIDDVKDALRCALQEEKAALLDDIDYLTALLTDETDLQLKAATPPPSLSELKQYSSKLKQRVHAEEGRLQHEQVVSRMFSAAQTEPSKAGKLRRMVSAAREAPQGTTAPSAYCAHRHVPTVSTPLAPVVKGGDRLHRRPVSQPQPQTGEWEPGDPTAVRGLSARTLSPHTPLVSKRSLVGHDTGSAALWSPGTPQAQPPGRSTATAGRSSDAEPVTSVTRQPSAPASHVPSTRQIHCPSQPVLHTTTEAGTDNLREASSSVQVRSHASCDPRAGPLSVSTAGPGSLPRPTDLLEAQAQTLKGGVAAILAKHNYHRQVHSSSSMTQQ